MANLERVIAERKFTKPRVAKKQEVGGELGDYLKRTKGFEERLRRFVVKNADLIFQMEYLPALRDAVSKKQSYYVFAFTEQRGDKLANIFSRTVRSVIKKKLEAERYTVAEEDNGHLVYLKVTWAS